MLQVAADWPFEKANFISFSNIKKIINRKYLQFAFLWYIFFLYWKHLSIHNISFMHKQNIFVNNKLPFLWITVLFLNILGRFGDIVDHTVFINFLHYFFFLGGGELLFYSHIFCPYTYILCFNIPISDWNPFKKALLRGNLIALRSIKVDHLKIFVLKTKSVFNNNNKWIYPN